MTLTKQQTSIKNHGIVHPVWTTEACHRVGLAVYIACAFLEQETGGGHNVYGHDVNGDGSPRPFWGHGEVTEANYHAYLLERDLGVREARRFPGLGRRAQGVGPMQLTWYAYQDEADRLGGCWRPVINMRVGFKIIATDLAAGKSLHQAALEYNGKESYAAQMDVRLAKWRRITGGI